VLGDERITRLWLQQTTFNIQPQMLLFKVVSSVHCNEWEWHSQLASCFSVNPNYNTVTVMTGIRLYQINEYGGPYFPYIFIYIYIYKRERERDCIKEQNVHVFENHIA
jgi:hypothetical protein